MTKELMKRSTSEHLGRVTISIGVATLLGAHAALALIERTDCSLFSAKRHGRNRVTSETDSKVTAAGVQQVA